VLRVLVRIVESSVINGDRQEVQRRISTKYATRRGISASIPLPGGGFRNCPH
jgi:hypothetical protein